MKIDYRRLTENELDTFINMRIKQLREDLDARVEESGCSPVCSPTLTIEGRGLQRNCYPAL